MRLLSRLFLLIPVGVLCAQSPGNDIPKDYTVPDAANDYIKRDVMIPMRDGIKLHTVIVIPKGARNAPILFTRTPYDASHRLSRNNSTQEIYAVKW